MPTADSTSASITGSGPAGCGSITMAVLVSYSDDESYHSAFLYFQSFDPDTGVSAGSATRGLPDPSGSGTATHTVGLSATIYPPRRGHFHGTVQGFQDTFDNPVSPLFTLTDPTTGLDYVTIDPGWVTNNVTLIPVSPALTFPVQLDYDLDTVCDRGLTDIDIDWGDSSSHTADSAGDPANSGGAASLHRTYTHTYVSDGLHTVTITVDYIPATYTVYTGSLPPPPPPGTGTVELWG